MKTAAFHPDTWMLTMENFSLVQDPEIDILKYFNMLINSSAPNNSNSSFSDEDMYAVPTGLVVLLAILYGSISLIAVIGNGLLIFVILKDKRMQTVTNIFIANLALADIIIGLFTTPFQFQPALHQRWDLPYFLCSIAPCFKILSVSVSVLTLTIISFDRYIAVMYPLKAGFSKKYAVLWLVLIWGIGIGSSFPEAYYYRVGQIKDGPHSWKPFCMPNWPSEAFGKYYHIYLVQVQYLLPLIIISFSYVRIVLRIWGTKALAGNTLERDNLRQRNKRKVVKMLIIVVLLFVICWMPLQVYELINQLYPAVNNFKYINVIWFCANWLAMSNACYNPFIYGLLNEKFKREYRLLFSKVKCLKFGMKNRQHNGFDFSEDSHAYGKRMTLTFRATTVQRRGGQNGGSTSYSCLDLEQCGDDVNNITSKV